MSDFKLKRTREQSYGLFEADKTGVNVNKDLAFAGPFVVFHEEFGSLINADLNAVTVLMTKLRDTFPLKYKDEPDKINEPRYFIIGRISYNNDKRVIKNVLTFYIEKGIMYPSTAIEIVRPDEDVG